MIEPDLLAELHAAAQARGAIVEPRGPGHFQIRGRLLVNYYPLSKRRSAYVDATTKAFYRVTPAQAVAMAFEAPPMADADRKADRGRQSRYVRFKRRMWRMGVRDCHWCHEPMCQVATSELFVTLDHRVPLARGGLDNPNNWTLAHYKCNRARGHNMPELKEQR